MSSVTFLASAVLTVCVLHAVDQNMTDAVDKVGLNVDRAIEQNQANSTRYEPIIKPTDAKVLTPGAQVFNAKKAEHLLPNQQDSKPLIAKSTDSI